MHRKTTLAAFAAALALWAGSVRAAPPATITYSGFLTDDTGAAVATPTNLTFRFYDFDVGGSQVGTADVVAVTPGSDGYFSAIVGTSIGGFPALFDAPVWMSVQVEGDAAEMTPRIPITSVPSALSVAFTGVSGIPALCSTGQFLRGYSGGNGVCEAAVGTGSITSGQIANGTITGADVAPATITGTNIASSAFPGRTGSFEQSATLTAGSNYLYSNTNLAIGTSTRCLVTIMPIVATSAYSAGMAYAQVAWRVNGAATNNQVTGHCFFQSPAPGNSYYGCTTAALVSPTGSAANAYDFGCQFAMPAGTNGTGYCKATVICFP